MKKFLVICFILLVAFSAFAYQETYRANSYEVETYKSLRRIAGNNQADPTYPISGSQLLVLLNNLDTAKFNEKTLAIYNELVDSIEHAGDRGYEYGIVAPFAYYGRTSDDSIKYDQLFVQYRDRISNGRFWGNLWWKEYAFLKFDMDCYESLEAEIFNKKNFFSWSNFLFDGNGPFEAFITAGYDRLNVEVGRDRLSSGNGAMFNLFLADNFVYEEFAKLSFIDNRYSYDLSLISFGDENGPMHIGSPSFNEFSAVVANHRFSISFFDSVTVSVYESMLAYAKSPANLKLINPAAILHNLGSFSSGNCNNAFGFEFSVNLSHGFEVNTQCFFDQIQLKGEYDDSDKEGVPPNAFALLGNVIYSTCAFDGTLDLWAEGVWTSPGCYLKEEYSKYNNAYKWYQIDWLLANRCREDVFEYIGYKYGPNSIGFDVGAKYRSRNLTVSAIADYHYTGTYKKGSFIDTSNENYGKFLPYCLGDDAVFESELVTGVSVDYEIVPGVEVDGSVGLVKFWNYGNVKGASFNDVQFELGVKFDLAKLADKYLNWRLR